MNLGRREVSRAEKQVVVCVVIRVDEAPICVRPSRSVMKLKIHNAVVVAIIVRYLVARQVWPARTFAG